MTYIDIQHGQAIDKMCIRDSYCNNHQWQRVSKSGILSKNFNMYRYYGINLGTCTSVSYTHLIALGGTSWKNGVWAGCSVLLSTVLQILGMSLGITTLTAPFVISVWIILMIQKVIRTQNN